MNDLKGPLFIVSSVAMFEAQLCFCLWTRQIRQLVVKPAWVNVSQLCGFLLKWLDFTHILTELFVATNYNSYNI